MRHQTHQKGRQQHTTGPSVGKDMEQLKSANIAGRNTYFGILNQYFLKLKKHFLKLEKQQHTMINLTGILLSRSNQTQKRTLLHDLICMRAQGQAALIYGDNRYWHSSVFTFRVGIHEESLRYTNRSTTFSGWELHRYVHILKIHQTVHLILMGYVACVFLPSLKV